MTKKELIIILIILICIGIIFFIKSKKTISDDEIVSNHNISIKSEYDEEEGVYEIYDENGELITTVQDEVEVEFYKQNPDFRESPPVSPNAELQVE